MHTLLDELELMGVSRLRFPADGNPNVADPCTTRKFGKRLVNRVREAAGVCGNTAKRAGEFLADQIRAGAETHNRMERVRWADSRYAYHWACIR